MHIWDEPKPALMQLDVYSCGDFSPSDICSKIMKDFDIHKIEYKYLNRETGLIDL
jgi:S-adenosylmethionine/arginine decarboxylase-like enzyme